MMYHIFKDAPESRNSHVFTNVCSPPTRRGTRKEGSGQSDWHGVRLCYQLSTEEKKLGVKAPAWQTKTYEHASKPVVRVCVRVHVEPNMHFLTLRQLKRSGTYKD